MSRSSTKQSRSRRENEMPAQHKHNGSFGPSGEIPVPNSQGFYGNGRDRAGSQAGPAPLDLARSPPSGNASNKNTKHVPCKFFRQGTCQAGNACPFSHSLDPMMHQAPCKYFMKGNCKFGAKCALAHYLPNGHRVSRADLDAGLAMGGRGTFNSGPRPEASPFTSQEAGFPEQFGQQPYTGPDYFPGQDQFPLLDDEPDAYNDRYSQYQTVSGFDPGLASPPTSQFGSPPNDSGFQKQTTENLRSALNAPLPNSFDPNSLPHIAKYGPFGASVPDKFGMRSPTSTLSRKLGSPPEQTIAPKLSTIGSSLRNVSSPISMSPQTPDESIGQRIMHSQKQTRPRMISASLPRTSLHDWEEGINTETDLLPNSLHDDILLPQEKMRRLSRPEPELSSSARSNGLNIPRRSSSHVGSPPTGSSPSRFRGLFEEQRKKEEIANNSNQNFGHVGSPLKESWMPHESADSSRGGQISGISQAMARMELNRTESTDTNGSTRPLAGLRSGSNFSRFDRTISSPGLTGRRIDEEGEGVFFEMDDESNKRTTSVWGLPQSHPHMQTHGGSELSGEKVPAEEASRTNSSRGIPIFGGFRP